ncbi:MAG: hypothetical protein N2C14_03530 [Planctomycetales bacterium]
MDVQDGDGAIVHLVELKQLRWLHLMGMSEIPRHWQSQWHTLF